MSSPERFARVLITCELETRTPLHIGDGGTTTRQGLTRDEGQGKVPVEISSVATDKDGHAYLPGRTLKGNLRSWLGHTKAPGDTVKHLFGQEGTPRTDESKSGPNEFLGGRAQILDAFVVSPPAACAVPYWDKDRLTGVTASTAIQRTTKTVRPKKLFHEEFVPAGIKFQVRITADDATLEEIQLLLFALHGFEHPDFPVRLGAGRKNGRGVMRVVPGSIRVKAVSPESLDAWLESEQSTWFAALVELPNAPTLIDASRELYEVQAPRRLTVDLELTFDGPFLVNDPSRTKKDGEHDPGMPDHAFLRDQHGRVLLPADSLRGALRSQAERILRTLGLHACHVDDPRDACPPVTEIDGVKTIWEKPASGADHEAGLCPACRLFGAAGWGSALEVSDFVPPDASATETFPQEFVAIDRFTGGVAGSAKFNAEAAARRTVKGNLGLELHRVEPWAGGLLALVLRDLAEGDIPLGFGAAKGYGACHAKVHTSRIAGHEYVAEEREKQLAVQLSSATPGANPPPPGIAAALGDGAGALAACLKALSREAQEPQHSDAPPPTPEGGSKPSPENGLFNNPYHFVPVKLLQSRPDDLSVADFTGGAVGNVTHGRYVEGTYSGRVVCRLETIDPLVIGSTQAGGANESKAIKPFEVDDGRPAIPASSLRGMISSVAEAASNSAFRALTDRQLSYRMLMTEALGPLGVLIQKKGEPSTVQLKPLTPGPLRWQAGAGSRGSAALPEHKAFSRVVLPVYLDGYRVSGDKLVVREGSFLARVAPNSSSGRNPDEHWYMQLHADAYSIEGGKIVSSHPDKLRFDTSGRYLLGQEAIGEPLSETQFSKLQAESPNEARKYTKGVLRVLGIEGREKQMPHGKKHELFIPLTAGPHPLDVSGALDRFQRLADARMEDAREAESADIPYANKGGRRNSERDPKKQPPDYWLGPGDIVFFRATTGEDTVEEISVSSIWRRSAGSVHKYFGNGEWLPFHPGREGISIAEQLFGFVDTTKKEDDGKALALAGRVRFSFGELHEAARPPFYDCDGEHPIPLRILASPKPPSPTFYFKAKDGGTPFVAKRELVARGTPQGRKFYLHRRRGDIAPWTSPAGADHSKDKLRVKVRPISVGSSFFFHVDFDNLSDRELALLCYALRPTPQFCHKLGMGKPLGLGGVRIDPVGVFYIDRASRYQKLPGDRSSRYAAASLDDQELGRHLPARYASERAAASTTRIPAAFVLGNVAECREQFRGRMDPDIRTALELLGDPNKITHNVRYPLLDGKDEAKDEHFHWFVVNEQEREKDAATSQWARIRRQPLSALDRSSKSLAPLKRKFDRLTHDRPAPSGSRRGSGRGGGRER